MPTNVDEPEKPNRARTTGVLVYAALSAVVFGARAVVGIVNKEYKSVQTAFPLIACSAGLVVSVVGVLVLSVKLHRTSSS